MISGCSVTGVNGVDSGECQHCLAPFPAALVGPETRGLNAPIEKLLCNGENKQEFSGMMTALKKRNIYNLEAPTLTDMDEGSHWPYRWDYSSRNMKSYCSLTRPTGQEVCREAFFLPPA